MELYKKYRPKDLKEIVGQDSAVNILKKYIKTGNIPHAILLTGPSGCGKTTIARILRKILNCSKQDFNEINGADTRGIDTIREIRMRMNQAPIKGSCRIWLIDECSKLSNDAQTSFLKMLEDTPNHVYFILATTDPQKLLKTIKTRCTEIPVKPISTLHLEKLIKNILKKEGKTQFPEEVIEKIIDNSFNSARQALVLLDKVIDMDNEVEMLNIIQNQSMEVQAYSLVEALLYSARPSWNEIVKILKELEGEDVEGIRYLVLACCRNMLYKTGPSQEKAYKLLQLFKNNFYDSKHSGLVAACYEFVFKK